MEQKVHVLVSSILGVLLGAVAHFISSAITYDDFFALVIIFLMLVYVIYFIKKEEHKDIYKKYYLFNLSLWLLGTIIFLLNV